MARNPLTAFSTFGGTDPFASLHQEMNRLFGDYRAPAGSGGAEGGSLVEARMNVCETDTEYRVTAEIPGVREEDIDIRLDDDVLTVRGEKKFQRTEGDEKENYHFVERSYGRFQRSMRLPMRIDPEKVRATCNDGVLEITLPKADQQERTRRIDVQRGKAASQGYESHENAEAAIEGESDHANKAGRNSASKGDKENNN
jgi:HSP20 family protein